MSINNVKPSVGKILISEPFLQDMYFRRSVVLLADYNEEGSFGLILNKPTESRLGDVISEVGDFNPKLFLGGPVQTDALFFVHRLGNQIEGSLPLKGNVSWGGNVEQIKTMIREKRISQNDIRFFIGYSGWSPKQLDDELKRNSWVVSDKNVEKIFDVEATSLWEYALDSLGGVFRDWKNFPSDPTMN